MAQWIAGIAVVVGWWFYESNPELRMDIVAGGVAVSVWLWGTMANHAEHVNRRLEEIDSKLSPDSEPEDWDDDEPIARS